MNGRFQRMIGKAIIASTFLFSVSPHAELVNAQASFVVFQSDMTQWLQDLTNKWLTPNQVIATELDINLPYHTIIKNLSWQGNASMNWTKSASTNLWTFDGQATNVTLYATDYEIHDTFPETIGGSTIYVRVDAVCQNLSFNFPGQWKVHGNVVTSATQNAVTGLLQNLKVTRSNQVPTIKVGSCVGPAGIQAFLNNQVAQLFADSQKIQSAAASEIQLLINTQLSQITAELGHAFTFGVIGATMTFIPQTVASLANGSWILSGPLMLNAPHGSGVTTVPKGYTDADLKDARASGFVVGNNLVSEILGFFYRAGLVDAKVKSSDVPAFEAFLQNRFQQYLAWGDLLNFKTTDVFDFDLHATNPIQVLSQKNTFPGIQWIIGVPVDALMSAPSQFGMLPYVEFKSTSLTEAIIEGRANGGELQITYSVSQMPLTYAYRKEFSKVRKVTSGIAVDTISGTVQEALTNQIWTYSMPDSASPIPNYRLLFQDLIYGTKTFRIEMNFQKK